MGAIVEIKTWRKFPILLAGWNVLRWEDGKTAGIWIYMTGLRFWAHENWGGPSEVQYDSKWGFMLTWPLCFVFWLQFKPQQTKINENGDLVRLPGTEKVLFFRVGCRWDAVRQAYEAPSLYLGLHYD